MCVNKISATADVDQHQVTSNEKRNAEIMHYILLNFIH